jgi:hypothetical protein
MQPQDLEILLRLREMPAACGLILQFGPHEGNNLGQVAARDPEYQALGPEVRVNAWLLALWRRRGLKGIRLRSKRASSQAVHHQRWRAVTHSPSRCCPGEDSRQGLLCTIQGAW